MLVAVVHIDTNDLGMGRREVLDAKFRLLGKKSLALELLY